MKTSIKKYLAFSDNGTEANSRFLRPPLTLPRLHITGYTGTLADTIPLRALYNDPSLLALLPQGDFRDAIRTTIPAFFYGETVDRIMINTTNVGRNPDQQSSCTYMPHATLATVCKVD